MKYVTLFYYLYERSQELENLTRAQEKAEDDSSE